MKSYYVTLTAYKSISKLVFSSDPESAALELAEAQYPDFEWEVENIEPFEKEREA